MKAQIGYTLVLFIIGISWALTLPLTKIAVSTGHGAFGLMLWQLVVGASVMSLIGFVRRRPLPLHAGAMRTYVAIALIGAIVPNSFTYTAAAHLPAGVLAILMSMIPMLAFPIALALMLDHFEMRRLAGLFLGLAAVLLIILPGADFKGAIPVLWVLAVMVACLCYGFEGNYLAKWGTAGCDPLEVLWGATLVGVLLVLPLVWLSGHWVPLQWGAPEKAQISLSILSVLAYSGYVWLVGRAGPVFAVQVSYIVTIFGVLWSAMILSEQYSGLFWLAMALMLLGMALVQPRARATSWS